MNGGRLKCYQFSRSKNSNGNNPSPCTQLTAENTDQVVVRVKNEMFLLFPSWLRHSVDPNQSDKKRITLSFNIMFSSYVETMSKPLWYKDTTAEPFLIPTRKGVFLWLFFKMEQTHRSNKRLKTGHTRCACMAA